MVNLIPAAKLKFKQELENALKEEEKSAGDEVWAMGTVITA